MNPKVLHNIKVAARRLNTVVPTEEQCKEVWKKLGMSGESLRSVLAAVVYVETLKHGEKEATMISYLVSQTYVEYSDREKPCSLSGAMHLVGIAKWGQTTMVHPKTFACRDIAVNVYSKYVAARTAEKNTPNLVGAVLAKRNVGVARDYDDNDPSYYM